MEYKNTDDTPHLRALKRAEALLKIMSFIYRQPLLLICISVVVSVILSMALVRTCWAHVGEKGNIVSICGNIAQEVNPPHLFTENVVQQCGSGNRIVRSNKELLVALKTAHNNISSREEIEKFPAGNLIDSSLDSYAYPNDRILDYTVDLVDLYSLNKITVVWNEFGDQSNYVVKWYLEGCGEDQKWTILARGDSPKSKVTVVNTSDVISQLRLRASAKRDWIGVYEMKIE